ncbi:MAG TPA: class I SAM-dependent methyltransferase [Acidimicrobiales bacterium]|nr:class I SAM-dependent methyltransferase [Acidimicrobiales bacterium]
MEQLKRLRLGPLDFVAAPKGRARKLFDNRLLSGKPDQTPIVQQPRVTREELEQLAKSSPEAAAIVDQIGGHMWYHTLDLGHGVRTPGFADHRAQMPLYKLPEDMSGMRCLDIATFDGFFAFEFERRGATDVVGIDLPKKIDIDCPRLMLRDPEGFGLTGSGGDGFKTAQRILGSKVQRVERSVYDLDPKVDGMFDFVFISDVLLHLRDPQLAIERAYSVCRGELVIADVYSPELDALGDVPAAQFLAPGEVWWYMNVACLRQMMVVAGFEPVVEVNRFVLDAIGGNRLHKVVLRGTRAENPSWYVKELANRVGSNERKRQARTV